MLTRLFVGAAALAFGTIVSAASAYAQAEDIDKYEYHVSCAVCHGDNGKGDGSLMRYYNKHAADLTVIQKNNNGVFPFDRVYEVIDGRQAVRGHGPGDMPVWGGAYSLLSWQIQNPSSASKDQAQESFTRGRIIALIGYFYTLQAK